MEKVVKLGISQSTADCDNRNYPLGTTFGDDICCNITVKKPSCFELLCLKAQAGECILLAKPGKDKSTIS